MSFHHHQLQYIALGVGGYEAILDLRLCLNAPGSYLARYYFDNRLVLLGSRYFQCLYAEWLGIDGMRNLRIAAP
jgi:hypothetical protein